MSNGRTRSTTERYCQREILRFCSFDRLCSEERHSEGGKRHSWSEGPQGQSWHTCGCSAMPTWNTRVKCHIVELYVTVLVCCAGELEMSKKNKKSTKRAQHAFDVQSGCLYSLRLLHRVLLPSPGHAPVACMFRPKSTEGHQDHVTTCRGEA